ncbi:MAG: hypothetical protein M1819_003235 [Sarea resinae]|nr:MAG: hypothetical protein M1819_003235 [Sarea resinae]
MNGLRTELEKASLLPNSLFRTALPSFSFRMTRSRAALALFLLICLSLTLSLPKFLSSEKPRIQSAVWEGNAGGAAEKERAQKVADAMRRTFWKYRFRAWGHDDILPVSGDYATSRNGWGAFIVDTSTTLSLMGLWEELGLEIDHIITSIDFTTAKGLVDPFETTIRYLGALVSLTDLIDAGVVPSTVASSLKREHILIQATSLAQKLAPSFDSPTGMVWPRVNFTHEIPSPDPPSVYKDPNKIRYANPSIGPARAGSNYLENRVLSRLDGDNSYLANASKAWAPLVWNQWAEEWPGMIDSPIDIFTGAPVGRQRHWDAGHDSYYEYLIKAYILAPKERYAATYRDRWIQAAESLRKQLSSGSSASKEESKVFIGKHDNGWYLNEMSHLACFVPGNLILGGRYLNRPDIFTFGLDLLEACHHTYESTATGVGPEVFSWIPHSSDNPLLNATYTPRTEVHQGQLEKDGFWAPDPTYRLRPEYVESLFYAWRITGAQKYRNWAWDAFVAIERTCRAEFGYAAVEDVYASPGNITHRDESESFWGAETLKYLWLTFADQSVGSLDEWVYSTEGHPFRIMR